MEYAFLNAGLHPRSTRTVHWTLVARHINLIWSNHLKLNCFFVVFTRPTCFVVSTFKRPSCFLHLAGSYKWKWPIFLCNQGRLAVWQKLLLTLTTRPCGQKWGKPQRNSLRFFPGGLFFPTGLRSYLQTMRSFVPNHKVGFHGGKKWRNGKWSRRI